MVGWFAGWVFWMWNKFYNMQMIYTIDIADGKSMSKKEPLSLPCIYFKSSYVE